MDSMIYYDKQIVENGYLLEVESSMVSALQSHLKRYILRSPIKVEERDDLQILHSWNNGEDGLTSNTFQDPRSALMGIRRIAPKSKEERVLTENLDEYLVHRINVGVGEGPDDFMYNSSLPLELNLDLVNGGI